MSRRQHLQLTLQDKALILIAVPLMFEVVLLITLFWLYNQEKEVAERAQHVKSVISKIEFAVHDLYEIGYSFIAYGARQSPQFEEKYFQSVEVGQKRINDLRTLVQKDSKNLATLKNVDKRLQSALALLAVDKRQIEAGSVFNVQDAMHLKQEVNRMVSDLRTIYKQEDDSLKTIQERLFQLNKLIPMLILSGVLVSIVIAVLLAAIFHKSTSKRLKMLMLNIASMAKQQPLRPTLTGNDEIARIDLVFHKMANDLNQTARQKQEFVDMISHDLRTPLSAVQTSLAILSTGAWGELSEKGKHKVVAAENNIRRSITLINNLLDLERMESGKLEIMIKEHELMPILEICLESVSQLAEQRSIKLKLSATDAVVKADDERLSQVLLNLLGNAIKFSPENSEVLISVQEKSGWTEIRVKDSGPGIRTDQQKLIFERFRQVGDEQARAKGTGLGLAICRLIVEAHGGAIGVESEEGNGSTFWFRVRSVQAGSSSSSS